MAGRGKGLNSKTFWTVTGMVDNKGQPIRFQSIEDAKAAADKAGGSPAISQWQADSYENGDTVISRWDPQAKDWQQVDVERDDKRADDFAKGGSASADESISAPPTQPKIVTRKPDGSIVSSDNPNFQPPAQITRPGPVRTVDQGDGTAITSAPPETVSQAQADYDLKAEQEKRAQQQAALQQAQQAEANAIAKGRLAVEQGQLTAQQARDKVNEELERIRLSLSAESNQLTKRGQDVSMRNADLSAGVSQRGQDMDYTSRLASAGTSLASAMLPYWNAPGQVESTNSLMAGGPPVPTRPTSAPPFSPNLPTQLAQQAQGTVPQQYTLPQVPGAAAGKYQLPPAA
jgi:hypothetical protein